MSTDKATCKILLIDDDRDFVVTTKMVLESRSECRVLTASHTVFGLSIVKRLKDLISSFWT
jgi:ActR/RegA family two-component response regulator